MASKWAKRITSIEKRMWTSAELLAEEYRTEVLLPYCKKHNLRFVSAMGDFFFADSQGSHICDADDAKQHGLKMKQIFADLNHEVSRITCLGHLVEEIREKDLESKPTELCPKCKSNPATEPHSCPYQADVNNDPDPECCTCCSACEHECAMDI